MAKPVEVVMLVGPPFAGKTAFYRRNLSSTHERISAAELFRQDPDQGLRQVILKIVFLLRRGQNVVIDDENWSRSTRSSYIKSISSKVQNCKFRCVTFKAGSPIILHWLREWYLAWKALTGCLLLYSDLEQREVRTLQWFGDGITGNGPELPTNQQDGFDDLQEVRVKLTAEAEYKFEVPALFVQWGGIIAQYAGEAEIYQLAEGTISVLQTWTTSNPWGRIIVVLDDSTMAPNNQLSPSTKGTLLKLSRSLAGPVYFCLPFNMSSNVKSPRPEPLPLLQRFHSLHLWHRGTLYLYHTQCQARIAQAAQVRRLSVDAALKSPRLVYLAQCSSGEDASDPTLMDVNVAIPLDSGQQRSKATIPWYSDVRGSEDGFVVRAMSNSCLLGVCCEDKETLDRFQELYASTATHISEPGTRMLSKIPGNSSADIHKPSEASSRAKSQEAMRELPHWMASTSRKTNKNTGRLLGGESLDDSSLDKPSRESNNIKGPTLASTIYCMSAAELYETALLLRQENASLDRYREHPHATRPCPLQKPQPSPPRTATTNTTRAPSSDDEVDANYQISTAMPSSLIGEIGTEEIKSKDEREARQTDGIFQELSCHRPPPRKAKCHKRLQNSSVLPDCFAPETVSTIPETAGSSAATIADNRSSTHRGGESFAYEGGKRLLSRDPSLSFLDDIF